MSDKIEIADGWARSVIVNALQTIVRNDTTYYEHHQPRRWDGATPDSQGGTIWLTPREIARGMLECIGAPVPNALADLRELVAQERADG